MGTLSEYIAKFDKENFSKDELRSFLSIHLSRDKLISTIKKDGTHNEEYYKWQLLYALIHSGLYPKDCIGTEIYFPKGNKSSAPLKIDAAIFDDKDWFRHYKNFHENSHTEELEWLRRHLIATLEIKKDDGKEIAKVWDQQLKSYLKESERDFCLGALYNKGRLYLFRKQNGKYLRFSDEYNSKGADSQTQDLNLHYPDSYLTLPDFAHLKKWDTSKNTNRSGRTINDLEVISGIQSDSINQAMFHILENMTHNGLLNQTGFEILIEILAIKIFDERENRKIPARTLKCYIDADEKEESLDSENLQKFLERIKDLQKAAGDEYHQILNKCRLDFKEKRHVDLLIEVVSQLQDYSFLRSQKTDLYQLIFNEFASEFSKEQQAQFITPIPLIDFLVKIVNPRPGESIIDPTAGISDFLSVSYVNSHGTIDDHNIYGMEIDDQMVMLSMLNMLLNGDGNAKIIDMNPHGSLKYKFALGPDEVLSLTPKSNYNGNWDERHDSKKLRKFDVVLTNPPFGKNQSFRPRNKEDLDLIRCYELWNLYNDKSDTGEIDKGVLFLENAYRILKENGRLGIILSNSIAAIDEHKIARQWLLSKMRIVAIFDLPANVFAETGVNTTLIVAYKPSSQVLATLQHEDYEVFARSIKNIGYKVKTKDRITIFKEIYKFDPESFETLIDENGKPKLDEEFTQTIDDFRQWCLSQEDTLIKAFLGQQE